VIEIKIWYIHTYMLIRGNAEDKNHNPILHLTWFSMSCLGVQVMFDYKICLL